LRAAASAVGFGVNDNAHASSLNTKGFFSDLRRIKPLALVMGSAFIPVECQRNIGRIVTRGHDSAHAFPAAFGIADAGDVTEVELWIDIEMFAIPQRGPFDQPFPVLMKSLRFEINFES
jgi:hypothetical protein